ncbi:Glyoxalase/Bleomycin resistance protein/Dihydroxybiphenyl dioxygenase [Leptodontidium sp. 2 PMI_412]|nr:Glyoxalase/Bleomycin resistance protein/Dihydroxybiphenyl dioxygenase [Leptodontidium sp. 2 PMI_412]
MATRIKPTPNSPEKIQLSRISHVRLRHPDPEKFLVFASDFGFVEEARVDDAIYLRGYGVDPYCYVVLPSTNGEKEFEGGAYVVKSKDDLDKAMKFDGAVRQDILHLPGGGEMVSLSSPGGTKIHLVWGQKTRVPPAKEPSAQVVNLGPYNSPFTKERRGEFQRFQDGPAMVHKLGHYGYISSKFDEDVAFYLNNFNITPTDILYEPTMPDLDVLTFLHIDLGSEYSDHHTLFFQRAAPGQESKMHHCSFEVADFDTQLLGHQWLADKGYTSVWGVGRHILGSQIFDYWKDTSGFKIEHYADGDVVNEKTETQRLAAGPDTLSIWGPPLPATFTQ